MTAPALRPPTELLGVVDAGAYYSLLTEAYEYVPDVMFPTSVITYGQMRRDPQLTAVLQAYMLPIRRATWTVDPTGCRDEVVRLVADDMGLPVLGDDQPGAARTRGMSWAEHLRTALMHLVYGFYGFELLAEINDAGQARLVNAYERVPQTVSFIHSLHTGDFGGISQIGLGGSDEVAEITPDRMAWYCHDREGSAWHGNSVLRSSFAPWLLKRECQRILGASTRRWGLGVPTLRALPGTTPTPEQMAAASAAAQAMRGGETAGMAVPPGFVVEIQGLVGQAPDTLAFLKWLDQQMSRTTLAGFLDLADTRYGSRALGSSFIDLFTLSITAVAEYVADVATRQIAARIVDWNWGESEPVPAVSVTDIGTKHEITAEAIQALMAAGAITPDPALEEYMRQAFQLPQRSIPWVPPVRKGGGASDAAANALADGNGDGTTDATSVIASAKRPARQPRRRRQPDGQMALPIAAAADTTPELDPQHQEAWQQALSELQAQWPDLAQPMVDDLSQQAGDDVDAGDLAALGALAVSPAVVTALAAAIAAGMTGLAATAAGHVVAEAKAQGKTIAAPADPGTDKVDQVAQAFAGILANGYASAAARKALQVATASATADDVQAAVAQVLTDMGTADAGWVADNLGTALSAGQNAGRFAALAANPPKRLVATEKHDPNTCKPCEDINQHEFATLADAEAAYPTGGYINCLGGLHCRGTVIGHW